MVVYKSCSWMEEVIEKISKSQKLNSLIVH